LQWLEEFKWLAYSELHERAFCKWCVAFATDVVSRSAKALGMMVKSAQKKLEKSERRLKAGLPYRPYYHGWRNLFESGGAQVGGHKRTLKNYRKFLRFELVFVILESPL